SRQQLLSGRALRLAGRLEEAEADLRIGIESAAVEHNPGMTWRLLADLGRVCEEQGHRADADTAYTGAAETIGALAGAVPEEHRQSFLAGAGAGLPPAYAAKLRPAVRSGANGDSPLTARERAVTELVAQGKSNRAIADELVLSERTVETHVSNILGKLGFSSRAQIVAWALEHRTR
ncbi:MAG TPA: response regulator transcription factor, partial [Dehalococcoidia bacterium]